MKFKKELLEILKNGTQAERTYICEKNLNLFGLYYFPEFFVYKPAPFHFDFGDDWIKLEKGILTEAAWIAFRESAKTSWAKMGIIHAICYKKKNYINWDSYDKANSEAALFDIAVWLQTNKALQADFGNMLVRSSTQEKEEGQKVRRIGNFVTNNGIKVEAFSTQESTRGRIYKTFRPDMYVFDDFENSKTKDSYPVTKKIIDHIDEAKAGLGPDGSLLFLGNYITEEGSVAHITEQIKMNKTGIVRMIPVVTGQEIAWPDKYELDDKSASIANQEIEDPKRFKISLESKRASLGNVVYETEMMNNPSGSGDYFFDRSIVRDAMRRVRVPVKEIGSLRIWSEHNAKYAFAGGLDTSEGKGLDSSAIAFINFTRRPMLVCATYERNDLTPVQFGHDAKKFGELYGECILCPEVNGIGYSTLATLLELEYPHIFQREVKNKKTGKLQNEYGIRSAINGFGVRWDLFSNFKTAFEDGEIEVWDADLLKEMYHFKKNDLELREMEEGMTRHFDKLTATVIAFGMKSHASLPEEKRKSMFFNTSQK